MGGNFSDFLDEVVAKVYFVDCLVVSKQIFVDEDGDLK